MDKTLHAFEWMMVAISRLLKNHETAATGTLSPVPAGGCLLAKATHAPDLLPLIYGDPDNRVSEGLHEFFGLAQQGKIDVFFLSGIQIDWQGRINLSVIGDYHRPKLRLPGGAGSNTMYAVGGRTILFTMTHTSRLFTPRVDFVNASAFDEGGALPWRRGGLSHVVTPMCVMAFDNARRRLVLESLLPGATLAGVQENTGFDLDAEGRDIQVIPSLTDEEYESLRGVVRQKMMKIYPLFSSMVWGNKSGL
jgi:glutaconate CoA-transferase subunit B